MVKGEHGVDRSDKDYASMSIQSRNALRAEQSYIRKTTYFETFIHLIKGNIGAGIFALGTAFKNAGIAFGFVGTVLLGLICTYNMHVIISSSIYLRDVLNLEYLPNFPDTIELCVLHGPKGVRKLNKTARILVKMFIVCTQLGFCSIYVLFVSSTAKAITLHHAPHMEADIRLYILVVGACMLITALIPTLKFLTPVSLIANLLILAGIILSIYLCSADGLPSVTDRPLIADYSTWALFFGTAIFSFEGIALVVPLRNEMKNPNLFQAPYGVLNAAMCVVILGTASMGFISYLKFGEEIKGSVTLNFDTGILAETVKICVGLGITFTYAIQFHVAVDVTWWDLLVNYPSIQHALGWEMLYRIILSIFTIFVAAVVPYLELFLALIGAMFSTALALFFPAVGDLALRTCPVEEGGRREVKKSWQVFRVFMDCLTLVIACVGWVAGTSMSLLTLYRTFRDKPYA